MHTQVIIGSPDLKANHNITQVVQLVADQEKYPKLIRLMGKEMDGRRILIFAETKRGCDDVSVEGIYSVYFSMVFCCIIAGRQGVGHSVLGDQAHL